MDEDVGVDVKPVTVYKKPIRKCTAKKTTVKKVVSKKEAAVPEEDKSKLPSTKEVKVLLTKLDDTRNKTDMENKTEIKVVLQIEDDEEGIEKTDKPKFKHVQKARRGKPISNANRSLDRKTLRDLKRVENIEELHDFCRKIELKPDYEIDISKLSYEDWLKMEGLNVSSSSEQNGDVSISKEEESSMSVELIDMENTENAVASEIEVHSNSNLLQFSEDEICEHYANLAMHIIAAFSNEFKSEEHVERLKTILKLLEEDKDEVLKCKGGNCNSEKRDIVEAECKETERVEAEHKKDAETVEAERTEAERVEAECKKEAERVEAECTETERVEAECKKDAEMVEAESTEAERVEAERKKEAEGVEAESMETERVEAERKKDAETVEAECKTEELCKEN